MTLPAPNYERGNVRLWLADCLDILPLLEDGSVDAVVTDPPYGMNSTSANMATGNASQWALPSAQSAWASNGNDWDDKAPEIVLSLPNLARVGCIIWGGQFFTLPTARGWLVWNKIVRNWQSSECELAWTNIEQAVKAFDYSHGQLAHEGKKHPTQKPLPLMEWCLEFIDAETILDPFMGSGTTGVACIRTGRAFLGIEKEPKYFEIACRRIDEAFDKLALIDPVAPAMRVQRSLLEEA